MTHRAYDVAGALVALVLAAGLGAVVFSIVQLATLDRSPSCAVEVTWQR